MKLAGRARSWLSCHAGALCEGRSQVERSSELYCSAKGWQFEVASDLGSGMNYKKRGLRKLLEESLEDKVGKLVLAHKEWFE